MSQRKKALHLWSDFLQRQAKQSLKQQLNFSDEKVLQLWSRFAEISSCKTIETTAGFLRYTRIAIMVTFPSNSS